MRRGEVRWVFLPTPDSSGPGMRRPVLVVQSNPFNESQIATVIVLVITSNLALAQTRGNVRVSRTHSGLPKVSVVNVSQVYTLDKRRLTQRVKPFRRRSCCAYISPHTETCSVAVIVRSERVAGKTLQGTLHSQMGKDFQGEGPTQVQFEVA
jgi:mRNA interferase MazF